MSESRQLSGRQMIQTILQVAFLVILAGLLIVQGLSATAAGQPAMVAVQVDDAACTSGYALWANGQGIFNVLEWPASRLNVQGNVRSTDRKSVVQGKRD